MLKSFKSKLIFIHIGTQLLFLGLFVLLGSQFVNHTLEAEFEKRVSSFTLQIESAIMVAMVSSDTSTLIALAQEAVEIPDIHEFSVYLDNKLIHNAISKSSDANFLKIIKHHVIKNNQEFGYFVFSISKNTIVNNRKDFIKNLWFICFFELLLTSLIALLIGNYLGNRAQRLENGLSVYSSGDISFRFTKILQDELGFVEKSFNEMASSIEEKNINLEKLRMQNLESAKMASLGEMAGGIAHEINNPLAVITMRSEKLKKIISAGEMDVPKIIEEIQKIESTAHRISKIIKGLKNFSRNGTNDLMDKFSMKQVVDESVVLSQDKIKRHSIELKVNMDISNDFYVTGRLVQLSQVVLNLIGNACDAISNLDERWIELYLLESDNKIILSLTDSGKGIPPEIVEKIMHPFFTTKEVGKGTGLGLSISKGIIEEHHGKLFYDPTCSNTRFIIELSRIEDAIISQSQKIT